MRPVRVPALRRALRDSVLGFASLVAEFLLTSVCRYPNRVDLATARLMPASRSAPDQTPYYKKELLSRIPSPSSRQARG